jgi:nickel/cobalt exporter
MVLLGLGIAGGVLPDPAALAILLSALAHGQMMLSLGTVLVFSLGFASTLVVVGVVAAKLGQVVLIWLSGPWVARLQTGTALLIIAVGIVLTTSAWQLVHALT